MGDEGSTPGESRADGTTTAAGTRTPLVGSALVVALAVITVWLGFLIWLAVDTSASEVTWSRLLVVLGSVEAVAFAAIGALFGTTVQRQRVEDLKARTDSAESRAEASHEAVVNGHILAAAVKATYTPNGTGSSQSVEQLSAAGGSGPAALYVLAERLFPDRG